MSVDTRNFIIDELTKMPPMVVSIAYLYATNYIRYGENVTEKWLTALQQSSALETAYRQGYYDAIQRMREEANIERNQN